MSVEIIDLAAGADVVAPELAVEVIDTPEGPMGAAGPASAAADYVHVQASPLSEWIVNHNLGVEPLVSVRSPGGVEVEADVRHISANQLRIYFASPYAGTARCV